MREIIGNLQRLGFTTYDTVDISFSLVNKLGKPISLQSEMSIFTQNKTTTITSNNYGDFTIELFKNSNIKRDTFYNVKIGGDTQGFNIYIPDGENAVDILCLVNQIDYDGILTIKDAITGMDYIYDDKFIDKLNSFFMDKKIYLTYAEKKMIDKFLSIAELPIENRCDDVLALDKYLATIGAE